MTIQTKDLADSRSVCFGIYKAIQFIESNLTNEITLDDVANHSPVKNCRL